MITSHHRHTQDQNAAEARRAAALGCLTMAAVSTAAAVAGLSGDMGLTSHWHWPPERSTAPPHWP